MGIILVLGVGVLAAVRVLPTGKSTTTTHYTPHTATATAYNHMLHNDINISISACCILHTSTKVV